MPMDRWRLPSLSLVLGGAASGKSAIAENLVLSASCRPHYVATMRRSDDPEMRRKIADHELARGDGWTTVEAPIAVGAAVSKLAAEAVLVDCATLWLANLLEDGGDPHAEGEALTGMLAEAPFPVVVVSNELGHGMVPMDRSTRAFRDAHGRLNQTLAARAGLVVLVTAGLPLALKGALPG